MATKDKATGETYVVFRARVSTQLREHEDRLNQHDDELAELDADILALTEVSVRAAKRRADRARLQKIRRRRAE